MSFIKILYVALDYGIVKPYTYSRYYDIPVAYYRFKFASIKYLYLSVCKLTVTPHANCSGINTLR